MQIIAYIPTRENAAFLQSRIDATIKRSRKTGHTTLGTTMNEAVNSCVDFVRTHKSRLRGR